MRLGDGPHQSHPEPAAALVAVHERLERSRQHDLREPGPVVVDGDQRGAVLAPRAHPRALPLAVTSASGSPRSSSARSTCSRFTGTRPSEVRARTSRSSASRTTWSVSTATDRRVASSSSTVRGRLSASSTSPWRTASGVRAGGKEELALFRVTDG